MIVIFKRCIQAHMEITDIKPRLPDTLDLYLKATQRETLQRLAQSTLIRPQIQKCCNKHIPTDSRAALQVQHLIPHSRLLHSLYAVQVD